MGRVGQASLRKQHSQMEGMRVPGALQDPKQSKAKAQEHQVLTNSLQGLQGQKGQAQGTGEKPDARQGCRGGGPATQNLWVVLRTFVIPRVLCVCAHACVHRDHSASSVADTG